jgi:SPP1 family predicted phage head-tail adaptor
VRVNETRPLNPGILRHQIVWQRKKVTDRSSMGEAQFEWVDVLICKAQVKPLQGREIEAAQQRWAEARYRITQHYVAGLNQAERGVWSIDGETRYLDILDIQDRGGVGRVMDILAKEWKA